MTTDTSREAVEGLIAEGEATADRLQFARENVIRRMGHTLAALLDERDGLREDRQMQRESLHHAVERIRDLGATVDNLRLISNANGDWNIKYQEVNRRAERAEAELLHARGISEIRGAERDKLTARMERLSRMQPIYDAAQTVKGTRGAVEIGGVRIEPCDEFGATETTRERDRLAAKLDAVKAVRAKYRTWHSMSNDDESKLDAILADTDEPKASV